MSYLKEELLKKHNLLNWFFGNLFVCLGICLSTKADFGLSMIAASPYILHIWLKETLVWFTQGTAEYFFEAVVLIATCIIIKQFKLRYLLSFLEAVIAGLFIDAWFLLLNGNGAYIDLSTRIVSLIFGLFFTSLGVAFFFRTTLPLQTYELAVVEIAAKYYIKQSKVKQIFDAILLIISLILSFLLTHKLTGVGIATVLAVLVNARLIEMCGKVIDKVENK